MREAIVAILEGSSLDAHTRDYVVELLAGDDEDANELEGVLSGFLTEEADASILQQLLVLKRGSSMQAPPASDIEPLRRLEQAVTIADAVDVSDAAPPPTTEQLAPLQAKEKEKKATAGASGPTASKSVCIQYRVLPSICSLARDTLLTPTWVPSGS